MNRIFRTFAALSLVTAGICASSPAQEAANSAPATPASPPLSKEEIDGATKLDALSMPTPGELMAAIDKLGKPDWASAIRPPIATAYSSRAQMALNIGGLIADGFIAVEAESAQQVKNIGKDILTVAKPLGVQQDILNRGKSLTDLAEAAQWDTLKEEFEATQNEVKTAMQENKDADLIVLVTLGGWIRGTEAMSDYISQHYSENAAKLLRQPGVSRFLSEKIASLPEKVRDDASVRKARAGLTAMEQAVSFGREVTPTVESVKSLNELTVGLLKDLAKKKQP